VESDGRIPTVKLKKTRVQELHGAKGPTGVDVRGGPHPIECCGKRVSRAPKLPGLPAPVPRRALQPVAPSETPHIGTTSCHKVATHLPGRENKEFRKRWHYSIAHTIRKGT